VSLQDLSATELRQQIVTLALEWERHYGVSPAITAAVSEFDAALLVGHSAESFALDCDGRTAVTRGTDFRHCGLRYQVKANRPSGKPGSFVTLVAKAKNYEWDCLIWLLYDRQFSIIEAWEWKVDEYRKAFDALTRLSPAHMRRGRDLKQDNFAVHPTGARVARSGG
jgi:hypothetical protein